MQIIDIIRNQIGFVDVEFLEKLGDTSNYSLMADGVSIVMTAYEEDEYIRIFTPNGGGVYYEDGNVLLTAEEKLATVISWEDRIVYYIMAEDIIKNNLKSPNSAKFASLYSGEITMQKKDEIVGVSSYVDAMNAFGVSIRTKWIVEFEPLNMSEYTYKILYIRIEDQEVGTFIDLSL